MRRHELRLEAAQALEVVERAEPLRGDAQRALDQRVVAGGHDRVTFVRQGRGAERGEPCAGGGEAAQRLEDEKVCRAVRRFRVAQNVFQIPAASRGDGTCGEEADERSP
jgi:hypothetical protein